MDKQFWLSGLIRFLIYFCHWMILAHIPVVFFEYGFSNIQIGILIGIFSLSSMFLMIPMGLFADLFSPRKILLTCAFSLLIYYVCLFNVFSFALLFIVMVLGGFGAAGLIVVSEALFLKQYGQENQDQRISYYQGFTYLGFGLGPLCGGYLLGSFGTTYLFSCAIVFMIVLVVSCVFLKDSSVIRFSLDQYRSDFKDKKTLLLIASIVVIGFHFGVEQVSTALILKEEIGLNPKEIGEIFGLLGLWMGCMVPFLAQLKKRKKTLFLFLLGGLVISGLFQSFTAFAESYWSFALIRGVHTFGDCLVLFELSVLIALLFPAKRLGGSSGFLYGVRTFAAFTAAIVAGSLNEFYGYRLTFILSGALMTGFALFSIIFILTNQRLKTALNW